MSSLYFAIAAAIVPMMMTIFVILPMINRIGAALQSLPL